MIDIGEDTWVRAEAIEVVRVAEDRFGDEGRRIIVGMASGQSFFLPKDWTVWDLFKKMEEAS